MTHNRVSSWLDCVHPSWAATFDPLTEQLHDISSRLRGQGAYQPDDTQVLRAFSWPRQECKVVLLGQDPYPTANIPVGLAFAVNPHARAVPASLRNITQEWCSDLDRTWPEYSVPDLTAWAEQGTLLLNTSLTVEPGKAGSHSGLGWRPLVAHVLRTLFHPTDPGQGPAPVMLAWGNHAQKVAKEVQAPHVVASAHPSPLSAYRGFFGSRPFTKVNETLERLGQEAQTWALRFNTFPQDN